MIYLVTNQKQLFDSDLYEIIGPDIALNKLKSVEKDPEIGFKLLGADTETTGLNFLKNKILTIQLGTEEWQIVWDCTSVPIHMLKIILEDEEYLTIWWNYLFDGLFLYKERIIPPNVYDGMIAEKLMYLGIDYKDRLIDTKNEVGEEYTPYSLKTAIKRYCNQELDKSVRGKIITRGLTPEVIVYAANDVKWEIPLLKNQYKALKEKDLVEAAKFENAFLPSLVYWKYCGVKLDIPRWKNKMKKDKQLLEEKEKALNDWVYEFYKKNSIGKNLVKVDLAVRKHTFGLGSVALLEIPSYYKPVRWYQEEEVGEDGTVWRIDKGEFEVPFGYFDKHKKLVPYIGKDIQLDLFAEVNTEEHCVIDWNSPGTLVPLFDMLGFKTTTFDRKTKKEKKSVSAKIIEPQSDISPIGKIYLAYKKAFKVVSSYGQNWLDQVDIDGRIHPEYNQLGTATARLSSGKGDSDGLDHDADDDSINIQNLPRDAETRACFCAENGNMWISEDYDSQESQIMASVTNDPAMLEFYRNGGGDMHSLVAKMSYPEIIGDCPVEEIKGKYRDYRQKAKSIEFAINPFYLTIPPKKSLILDPNIEYTNNFILGYFDGDGCIRNSTEKQTRYECNITCGSKKFLENIKSILDENNIYSIIYEHTDCNAYKIRIDRKRDSEKFYKWLYKDAVVCLSRKLNNFVALYGNIENDKLGELREYKGKSAAELED